MSAPNSKQLTTHYSKSRLCNYTAKDNWCCNIYLPMYSRPLYYHSALISFLSSSIIYFAPHRRSTGRGSLHRRHCTIEPLLYLEAHRREFLPFPYVLPLQFLISASEYNPFSRYLTDFIKTRRNTRFLLFNSAYLFNTGGWSILRFWSNQKSFNLWCYANTPSVNRLKYSVFVRQLSFIRFVMVPTTEEDFISVPRRNWRPKHYPAPIIKPWNLPKEMSGSQSWTQFWAYLGMLIDTPAGIYSLWLQFCCDFGY